MSFNDAHMGSLVNGIRINTSYGCKGIYHGMTIDTICKHYVTGQETGSTKFPDVAILPHVIHSKFNLLKAGKNIGYKISLTAKGHETMNIGAIKQRLCRMNIANIFYVIREMLDAGIIKTDTLTDILNKKAHPQKVQNNMIIKTKIFRYYAKAIVIGAMKKFITVEEVAREFKVTTETINYWLTTEVEDIMKKPGNWIPPGRK